MRLLPAFLHVLLALALAPLLPGVINRTKAWFGGRHGRPLFQLYYDLAKLARKSAVYSRTTTWVFRAGPVIAFASSALTVLLLPFAGQTAPAGFPGDFLLLIYLFALGRFFTMAAALDTGSAFEGMGASREATFSALAEPAFFLGLAALAFHARSISLGLIYERMSWSTSTVAPLMLVAAAFFVILLIENSRIPFDDPETHLELTMIHEVMVLDRSGPDFLLIQYGAALKLWVMAALFTGILAPAPFASYGENLALALGAQGLAAVLIGIVESTMARLRLARIPQMLTGSIILSLLSLLFLLRPFA
ncbi:NADH-quinone oxidoreductase subunit H [bacterium]|nr:NADH-quinone oxidoreductase subunit H [bacterium]